MRDELKSIIEKYAVDKTKQETLQELIKELYHLCDEMDLDFDNALDGSSMAYEDCLDGSGECVHPNPFPCQDGSIYCSSCDQFIFKHVWRS